MASTTKKALKIMSEGRRSNVKMSAAQPARTRALSYCRYLAESSAGERPVKTCACSIPHAEELDNGSEMDESSEQQLATTEIDG
jgi:hypothetical protein